MTNAIQTGDLGKLEAIVERGLSRFVEVGKALAEIRDRLLYREAGFETWEAYTKQRWGLAKSQSYRLIESARVAELIAPKMSPIGDRSDNLHEYIIRPLTASGLSDEMKVAAWQSATELAEQDGEPVQEKHVRFAVEHLHETRTPPMPNGKWQVIYADPPWQYDFSRSPSRDVENQYPTMPTEAIADLPIGDIAAADCVLFLWVPSPKLPQGLSIMAAWGFDYKTCMVWVKDRIGMGYYARQQHELLLIGAKGEPGIPPTECRPPSVISAPREGHSAKPEIVYSIIDAMYPAATKAELFARGHREGWTAWGNQA